MNLPSYNPAMGLGPTLVNVNDSELSETYMTRHLIFNKKLRLFISAKTAGASFPPVIV